MEIRRIAITPADTHPRTPRMRQNAAIIRDEEPSLSTEEIVAVVRENGPNPKLWATEPGRALNALR